MAKHHLQATKKRINGPRVAEHKTLRIQPSLPPAAPVKDEENPKDPAFLAWPSHLFEMMQTPWRPATPKEVWPKEVWPKEVWKESWNDFTPLEAWVENRRANRKPMFPKAESLETEKAYFYTVALPRVSSDQIALTFQGDAIILQITLPDDPKKTNRYPRSRTIHRAFTIPLYTNGEAITAELKEGVLIITLPKADKPVPAPSPTLTLII